MGEISSMKDRIKVHEAMGWELKDAETYSFADSTKKNYRKQWHMPNGITYSSIRLPDPENDANADVEILKFARENWHKADWTIFKKAVFEQWEARTKKMSGIYPMNYEVGDYFRAALGVIE